MIELTSYGFLSPEGKYYVCDYMEHLFLAEIICKENNYIDDIVKYSSDGTANILDCEEYLFAKGYLGIASRYMAHSCYRGARIGEHDFGHVHLSEVQKKFLEDNLSNAWNEDQEVSMEKLLRWDDYVDELNNNLK